MDIGSPVASRSRWIRSSRPPGRTASPRVSSSAVVADIQDLGQRVQAVLRIPRLCLASFKGLRDFGLATKVPCPACASSRPSITSSASACLTVVRECR